MAIWDVFTGKPGKDAAQKSRDLQFQMAQAGIGVQQDSLENSLNAIGSGFGNQRTALTGARGDVTGAYGDATAALDAGGVNAGNAFDRARTDIAGAGDQFIPLAQLGTKYGQGTSLYMDALGINGPEAAARARASFTPSLSYDFTLNQGIDAINRRRNAGGMLASGNADRDAQDYAAGLASRESNSWLDRLGGLVSPELAATGGAATGRATAGLRLGDLGVREADANALDARTRASLATGRGAMLADLQKAIGGNFANEGTGVAGLWTGYGKDVAGNLTGTGQRVGQTYKDEADASMAGSKNLWDFGLNLAKLGVGAAGGFGGMPSFGGGQSMAPPFLPNGNVNYAAYG